MTMADSDAALTALYQPRIREFSARVRADRRLEAPSITVTCRSPVCGSMMTLDLLVRDGILVALGWKARACTLGMASLGIVSRSGVGQTQDQIADAGRRLCTVLRGQDVDFPRAWRDLSVFAAARGFPTRFASIGLPFQAIAQGFAQQG
ncbi:iron-sulfur cluster assembly scaffold protein [Rhodobacteraceae bacterium F11138]|nr:iron-sulfur cluster assembly scaffold protein [Rhodobacteraceae bacterium F11138]